MRYEDLGVRYGAAAGICRITVNEVDHGLYSLSYHESCHTASSHLVSVWGVRCVN